MSAGAATFLPRKISAASGVPALIVLGVKAPDEDARDVLRERLLVVPLDRVEHAEHVLGELLAAVGEDEGLHDLVRALHDAVDAVVAPEAVELVLGHVALAAHDLHRSVDDDPALLGAEVLARRRLDHDVGVVAVQHAARHVEHRVHRERRRVHERDALLDEFKVGERAVELVARLDPLRRLLGSLLGRARDAGRSACSGRS